MEMETYDAIIKAREAIRKKYNELRRGESETAVELEKTFAPITKPLKVIAGRLPAREATAVVERPPEAVKTELEVVKQEPIDDGDGDDVARYAESNFGPAVAPYISDMIFSGKDFDHVYGVRLNERGRWCIGKDEIAFGMDDTITIARQTFQATPGLLELIFKKSPGSYTDGDAAEYKRILELTNAHRRGNRADGVLIANRTSKYRDIVRVLFQQSEKTGAGLFVPYSGRSYVYWDDPNELVERLQLLRGSKAAGHTGLAREILSIEEELREAKYIV